MKGRAPLPVWPTRRPLVPNMRWFVPVLHVEYAGRRINHGILCLCVFCVGPLCGPPLWWWVLCGALPSAWAPCVGPLCGSPVWVPCVGPHCVGPLCGSLDALHPCGIYSRDVSRSFTRSRSFYSYLACFVNTFTLNIYGFLSYTGFNQAEYVIHMRMAASQEYVNTYSTSRRPAPFLAL